MLNICIPVGGKGSRFYDAGYTVYKPFLPVGGMTMLERVIENVTPKIEHQFYFVCRTQDVEQIKALAPSGSVVIPDLDPTGAASGVALATSMMAKEDSLVVVNSDGLFDLDINQFLMSASFKEGYILTFFATDPKWSFVRTDMHGDVIEVAEKDPISDEATCGIYYWRNVFYFNDAFREMVRYDYHINGDYYVCPVYNFMPRHLKIGTYQILEKEMHGLGTPEDYEAYLKEKGL